jgi:glycosyltransferase involved in cell wall biosynthesis
MVPRPVSHAALEVSVVLATHDRPMRLARQLEALRAQSVPPDRYEIVVVDDASGPETRTLLEREQARDGAPLTVIHREESQGPAAARNEGWRAARAPLIAFTDDDCQAPAGWLEAGLSTARENPGAFVQGPTEPIPGEYEASYGPFSHTMLVTKCGPGFETCNIFYPRQLLERLGGFDSSSYSGPGGEDTDLGWKAIEEAGVQPVWAPEAFMYHAVTGLGPIGKIRMAARWHESMLPFRRYKSLRKHRYGGLFWSEVHQWMFQALVALLLPKRLWWLRAWLAAPYVVRLAHRRSGPLLAPYLIVHDLVEVSAVLRGAIRYRTLIL